MVLSKSLCFCLQKVVPMYQGSSSEHVISALYCLITLNCRFLVLKVKRETPTAHVRMKSLHLGWEENLLNSILMMFKKLNKVQHPPSFPHFKYGSQGGVCLLYPRTDPPLSQAGFLSYLFWPEMTHVLMPIIGLNLGGKNFFCMGQNSKYCRLCGPPIISIAFFHILFLLLNLLNKCRNPS